MIKHFGDDGHRLKKIFREKWQRKTATRRPEIDFLIACSLRPRKTCFLGLMNKKLKQKTLFLAWYNKVGVFCGI